MKVQNKEVLYKIQICHDEELKKQIGSILHEHNTKNCEYFKKNYLSVNDYHKDLAYFKVLDNNQSIGGITGWIEFGWYYICEFALDSNYRKQGIGSYLLKEIEQYARIKGCYGIRLETWSFQAKDFYEKNNYEVYAKLEDYPVGATFYYLKKILKKKNLIIN